MDRIVLNALAKATLSQQTGDEDCQIDTAALDGFEDPHELASQLLGIDAMDVASRARSCYDHHYAFKFGFDFALQLGAAIARDPSRIPDISGALEKSRSDVRQLVSDGIAS